MWVEQYMSPQEGQRVGRKSIVWQVAQEAPMERRVSEGGLLDMLDQTRLSRLRVIVWWEFELSRQGRCKGQRSGPGEMFQNSALPSLCPLVPACKLERWRHASFNIGTS
jgi:hypothetical protein